MKRLSADTAIGSFRVPCSSFVGYPSAPMWNARRILREIADADRRRRILTAFWKHADTNAKLMAQMQLAKALHFRDETIRKMPPEKKADLLASRIGTPEFEQFLDAGLMA